MKRKLLFFFAIAIAMASIPLHASVVGGPGKWYTHYNVTLNAGETDVTSIMLLENFVNGGSATWAFGTNCGGDGCTTQINNPFGFGSQPTNAVLVGLTNNQQDVVLITNTQFAGGQDWNTLFPATAESDLAYNIALATSGQDWPIITPGLNFVGNFAGQNPNLYFTIANGSFNVWEYTDGQLVGNGTSSVSFVPNAVPEPSSLLMLGTGLVGIGASIRRKILR